MEETIKHLIDLPNTFIGEAPIEEPNCQWIAAHAGSQKFYFTGNSIRYPAFSIYVRRELHKDAREACVKAFEALNGIYYEDSTYYVTRLPRYVGRDEKGRTIYSFTVEIQIGG